MVMSIVRISLMNQNVMHAVQELYTVEKRDAWVRSTFVTVLSIVRMVKMNEIAVRDSVIL